MNRKKNILIILITLLILFVVGYFIYSYFQLNDKHISRTSFNDKQFISLDEELELLFKNEEITIKNNSMEKKYKISSYQENIFEIVLETEKLYIMVLDENTIYLSNLNKYLYYL